MGTIIILASHRYLLSVEVPKKRGDAYISGCSIGPHDTTAVHNVPRGRLSDGKFRKDKFINEQEYNKE